MHMQCMSVSALLSDHFKRHVLSMYRFKRSYAPVDKEIATAYRQRLIRCYGLTYKPFHVSSEVLHVGLLCLCGHCRIEVLAVSCFCPAVIFVFTHSTVASKDSSSLDCSLSLLCHGCVVNVL